MNPLPSFSVPLLSPRTLLCCAGILLFTACASVPPPPVVDMPPANEVENDRTPEPTGGEAGESPAQEEVESEPPHPTLPVHLEFDGRPITVKELHEGEIPMDSVITIVAEQDASYSEVNDLLQEVADAGYLVEFELRESTP